MNQLFMMWTVDFMLHASLVYRTSRKSRQSLPAVPISECSTGQCGSSFRARRSWRVDTSRINKQGIMRLPPKTVDLRNVGHLAHRLWS